MYDIVNVLESNTSLRIDALVDSLGMPWRLESAQASAREGDA